MTLLLAGSLRGEFKHRTEDAYRQRLMHMQREDRERKEKQERLDGDDSEFANMAASIVAIEEVDAFRSDLETYQTATVAALQKNAEELDAVEAKLEEIFDKAHVLPDGRRVFKTEDGLRVFDEHGAELERSVVDPLEIPDDLERWESVRSVIAHQKSLIHQRTELLDYQEQLDDAQERLDAGDITRAEFDTLKSDITGNMPDAVRAQIPGMETAPAAALDLDITDNLKPTVSAPGMGL